MEVAMRLGVPDRVPVMCQLALGHYFLHSGLDAIDVWHDSDAFAEGLICLQRRGNRAPAGRRAPSPLRAARCLIFRFR